MDLAKQIDANASTDSKFDTPLAFSLSGVGVRYRRFGASKADVGFSRVRKRFIGEWFWALDDISYSLESGSILGIVGHNGAGKSTLVRVISGLLPPDRGSVQTFGKVSSIFNTAAGFDFNLSGRDNVYLKCSYLGFSRKQTDAVYNEIVEFADLDGFMDMPVRTYSKGMRTRLGFSVATCIQPDILILDEVLGSGDRDFRARAENRMDQMMAHARAIVMVSHNMKTLRRTCNKVLWLDRGRIKAAGPADEVLAVYDPSE